MDFQTFLLNELKGLKSDHLYRYPTVYTSPPGPVVLIEGIEYIQMSSNNYLNLCCHPVLINFVSTHIAEYGLGSSGSRLLSGYTKLHKQLEDKIADFKGKEAALVFSSGYVTNLAIISTLAGKNDGIYVDRLNHASIIDGARLSGAKLYVFKHKDYKQLDHILRNNVNKHRFNIIISDSVFSMDGDTADLQALVNLKKKYETILMIDDAHGLGVFGTHGEGFCHSLGLSKDVDIEVGTLSKALGLQGGFVTGHQLLIDYLYQKARGFVYSTSVSPMILLAAYKALEILEEDTRYIKTLWHNIELFNNLLRSVQGLSTSESHSAIIPVEVGDLERTLTVSQELYKQYKIIAPAIRPPTVKIPRIRFGISSGHTDEMLSYVIESMHKIVGK